MKPERSFIAERMLAQHCPELLRPAPLAGELLPSLGLLGDRLARSFAAGLVRMSGGEAPLINCGAARECTMAELSAEIAPLAANSLMTCEARSAPFLASIEATAVLSMVDRAFGGRGRVASPLPDAFPLSAELLMGRLETIVAQASCDALGAMAGGPVRALRRDGSLQALAPFGKSTAMLAITLDVHEAGSGSPWTLTLAFPLDTMTELFGGDRPSAQPAQRAPIHPADEPFGDMPLPVTALLVDMSIGFSRVADLRVGDILPVAVARSVPLKIGTQTIAHGTIGEVDDRVAVQITTAF